jgi:acetyl-CoA carboxylase biotin carboxyl carrier protein
VSPADLDLLVDRRGERVALLSPEVGLFTQARDAGEVLAAGAVAGVILVLGRPLTLRVPRQIEGRILEAPPARARQPVGWGDLLYLLDPSSAAPMTPGGAADSRIERQDRAASAAGAESSGLTPAAGGVFLRAQQSGRFYLRPAPGEPAFAAPGAIVSEGEPLGLIEVMKTFAHVRYSGPGLPARARIVGVLVEDGAEVSAGDALFEVESADS